MVRNITKSVSNVAVPDVTIVLDSVLDDEVALELESEYSSDSDVEEVSESDNESSHSEYDSDELFNLVSIKKK